jgi:hypothetical protein
MLHPGMRQSGRDSTRDGGAAARRLRAGGWRGERRDERSEELGISVGSRNLDRVDKEERA